MSHHLRALVSWSSVAAAWIRRGTAEQALTHFSWCNMGTSFMALKPLRVHSQALRPSILPQPSSSTVTGPAAGMSGSR